MIIIVPCYIIILCIYVCFQLLSISLKKINSNSSEPSAVAHVEAAVLQGAASVEPSARSSPAAGVERQPAQGRRQTRSTATMLTGVKLNTTMNLLQFYDSIKI
jgi:hypothetical protein